MKMARRTRNSLILLVAGVLAFLGGERVLYGPAGLLARRGGEPESESVAPSDLPPHHAFLAVGLGGFRGLLADALWLRAARLQDEGRYLEIVQLARWITQLEPQFTETWVYHAWNMAYNIGAMFADPADRWRWVQNGLRLLRDEGARWNPGDPRMYWEIGWIYQHKIGGDSDPAAAFFQRELAVGVEALLPGGLYRADRVAADSALRERLIAEYRLDPRILDIVRRRFGDLDWRLAESHAVYWAVCGLAAAGEKGSLPSERMIYSAMMELFRRGTLVMTADGGTQLRLPALDLAPSALRALESAMAAPDREFLRDLHLAFLGDAILLSMAFGREAQAEALWELRRTRYPNLASFNSPAEFVRRYTAMRMHSLPEDRAWGLIGDAWLQSFRARGAGLNEMADGYRRWAEWLWQGWREGDGAAVGEPSGIQ